ncbi:hypothetical protein DF268_39870 [Streptomyces sp. V2]|uniref:DUF6114 domain-containing protein n=1 Tax=Streptomyces niveiscabiei TaxID=164115 RepID=A0ABW9HPR8_9ACTN|nr:MULTISPECIES: DUF6114 domain-containing protein [Streptomyces]PWG08062.1 hypothetical protein DF268_39870 [Streptomyces sp. V2]QZZ30883.1 hypothetical protein A7X85_35770 [Streptomyces sp. ST1015]
MTQHEPPAVPEPGATASAEPAAKAPARQRFRQWRGRRPFVGGVLLTFGGAEILLTMKAPLPVILHIGMQGLAGYLLPSLMILCGLLILFNPAQRLFYSVTAVLLSVGTWVTSNIGGFMVGLLCGLIGGSMAFGWLPDQEPRRTRRQRREESRSAAEAMLPKGAGEPA